MRLCKNLKTLLCFNKMLHFVVNIRDRKSCEERNTQRSPLECNTERQRNEKHVRERKKHHKGQKGCVCVCVCSVAPSHLTVTPWTAGHQAPLSMGFSSKNMRVDCHFLLQKGQSDKV